MTWLDEYGRIRQGQKVISTAMIPPPATQRPKPPPPPGGWPRPEQLIDEHVAAYHPGRPCRENERGECIDRFGPKPPVRRERARDVPMLAYDLPLRPDLLVRLILPRDLTPDEAERLCGIIRTLPLPSDPDIWVTTENVGKARSPQTPPGKS